MRYPGLEIVGRRNGYFARGEEAAICEEINRSGADIVWVGGLPLEHAFCVRNRSRLQAGWIVTAGGCFNYVTRPLPPRAALDAEGRARMAAPLLARTAAAVLALCRHQSPCALSSADAYICGS